MLVFFKGIYDEFVAEFAKKAKAQIVGDGLNEKTHLGPVINKDQYERIIDFMTDAKEKGATIVTGMEIRFRTSGILNGF